jgi:hypothetical protein
MNRLFMFLLAMCFFCSSLFATVSITDIREKGYMTVLGSATAVASTATVYTDPISVMGTEYHGVYFKLNGTTPSVKVYIQSSYCTTSATFGDINTNSLCATIASSTVPFIDNITIPAMGYIRFKIVGQAGNGAGTTFDGVIYRDSKVK